MFTMFNVNVWIFLKKHLFADTTFTIQKNISILDLSHNSIMGIDDNTFAGMDVSFLDLGYNSLRRIPNIALRKLVSLKTLIFDGNLFHIFETGSLHDVQVKFLSISNCKLLQRFEKESLSNLPQLETVTLENNPHLAFFHPAALTNVPSLLGLLLSNNNLTTLENMNPFIPSLKRIFINGNKFLCHCSLVWIQKLLNNNNKEVQLKVQDAEKVTCGESGGKLMDARLSEGECQPYILPLFPAEENTIVGHNVTWPCRMVGSGMETVIWNLTHGELLTEGQCMNGRVCVQDGSLELMFLHPEDSGEYICFGSNDYGNSSRSINLKVQVRVYQNQMIMIFPHYSVAAEYTIVSRGGSLHLCYFKLEYFKAAFKRVCPSC